jgi:hypothetical protein
MSSPATQPEESCDFNACNLARAGMSEVGHKEPYSTASPHDRFTVNCGRARGREEGEAATLPHRAEATLAVKNFCVGGLLTIQPHSRITLTTRMRTPSGASRRPGRWSHDRRPSFALHPLSPESKVNLVATVCPADDRLDLVFAQFLAGLYTLDYLRARGLRRRRAGNQQDCPGRQVQDCIVLER